VCLSIGCATTCFADDDSDHSSTALRPAQLGNYFLEFDTNVPRYGAPDPSGLTLMTRETAKPFFGLKFSTPLSDNFLGAGRHDEH
jgi:hypothetical protein